MTEPTRVPTPGQTVGPFFHDALPVEGGERLVPIGSAAAVRLHGRVLDGRGDPVPDALLEIWQADATGRVVREQGSLRRGTAGHGAFTGFGRTPTGPDGTYAFSTLEPGATAPGGARFIAMTVLARGLLDRLFTRAYLPDDEAVLMADPLLASLDSEERASLVARREIDGSLCFDVRLQGEDETVFLSFSGGGR